MRKMTHKKLLSEARRMMTPAERKAHRSSFQSAAWEGRKAAKELTVDKLVKKTLELKNLLKCPTCHRKMDKIEGNKYHGTYSCPDHPDIRLSVG